MNHKVKLESNSTFHTCRLMPFSGRARVVVTRSALLPLSLLAGASAAVAQSSVTIYGVVDAGARYSDGLDSSYAGAAGSAAMLNSGINTTSRLGYRGSEDLGGGALAVFQLETGINVDSGATANATKFFDRASYLGLQTSGGSVITLGRQTSLLADAVGPVDPLGSRFASFNPNINIAALSAHRLGLEYGPVGSTTGAYRLDNSVKVSGKFSDFTVRAMHALGEQAGSAPNPSSSGLGVHYQSGHTVATLAYSQFKTVTGLALKGYLGGVSTKLGDIKLSLSHGSNEAETTAAAKTLNRTLGMGGTMPLTDNLNLILAHYRVSRTRAASVDDGFHRTIAFLEYNLSKRSLMYAELDQTRWQNGYQGKGSNDSASGISLGVKHTF